MTPVEWMLQRLFAESFFDKPCTDKQTDRQTDRQIDTMELEQLELIRSNHSQVITSEDDNPLEKFPSRKAFTTVLS